MMTSPKGTLEPWGSGKASQLAHDWANMYGELMT